MRGRSNSAADSFSSIAGRSNRGSACTCIACRRGAEMPRLSRLRSSRLRLPRSSVRRLVLPARSSIRKSGGPYSVPRCALYGRSRAQSCPDLYDPGAGCCRSTGGCHISLDLIHPGASSAAVEIRVKTTKRGNPEPCIRQQSVHQPLHVAHHAHAPGIGQ